MPKAQPYASQVIRRAWDIIGHFDLLVGVFAAFVAVAGWEELLSAEWTDRLLLWSAILLTGSFVAAAAILAPWSLWRETKKELDQFNAATASPPTIELVRPHPLMNDGVLLRLMVTNASPIERTFRARIVRVDGLRPFGPEPPWSIPWRHGAAESNHALPAYDREMLKIANVWPDRFEPFVLDPQTSGGLPQPEANTGVFEDGRGTFHIRVWDCESRVLVYAVALTADAGNLREPQLEPEDVQ